jgi:pimeloyl-ACP methyl ester carboxylesterase
MRDGRVLRGRQGETFGLAEMIDATDPGNSNIKDIVFVNDDLRMIFVPRKQIAEVKPDSSNQADEKFQIKQPTQHGTAKVMAVGPPAGPLKDFDDFGRRIFPMQTAGGQLDVIQAITVISPEYIKVVGLNYSWDMRVSTSTLSTGKIRAILWKQIDPKNLEHRKKIVRFWLQTKRYDQADREIAQILEDFKDQTDIQEQVGGLNVKELSAKQILRELQLRGGAGQHKLVQASVEHFPDQGVSGETLQVVREIKQKYEAFEARRSKVLAECTTLADGISDPALRSSSARLLREMNTDLDIENLARMAAYTQNAHISSMAPSDKLSLALSGWLVGADAATPNLEATVAMVGLRDKVVKFLSAANKVDRNKILPKIISDQAAKPEVVAHLLTNMKPPMELPELVDPEIPNYFKLQVNTIPGEPPADYFVQLPPEYSPYHRYPAVVSLHGLNSTAEMQIEWWAGAAENGQRRGQATRQGYIVIAPDWTEEHQKEYTYSAREHAAVLGALRDALRRFSVDTDRVFLSGHMVGGDAAWDIGVSHPDLWAGVIPIAAEANRYVNNYWHNARNLPFYVVVGELDGGRRPGATLLKVDSLSLDRYMQNATATTYNTTVVEYMGRGQDHFVDEQLPIFDWMSRFRRNFFPREFACDTMRTWDNFFYWAELKSLPPGVIVNPASWPPPRNTHSLNIKGATPSANTITLTDGNVPTVIWLSPEMVDFKSRVTITANGRRATMAGPLLKPSAEIILEDVRARGDRQHPFWAKVEVPGARL